jgi:hypothetical protein
MRDLTWGAAPVGLWSLPNCFDLLNFASTTFIGIRPGLATVLKYADRAVTRGVCLGLRMSLPIPVRRYFR